MARLPRLDLEGIPQHIIQRGNNKDVCFVSEQEWCRSQANIAGQAIVLTAWGKSVSLCSPHEKYLALGLTEEVRLEHYRALFKHQLDKKLIDDLREVTQKGLALGNTDFIEKVEQLSKRRATSGKPGRPKKE